MTKWKAKSHDTLRYNNLSQQIYVEELDSESKAGAHTVFL